MMIFQNIIVFAVIALCTSCAVLPNYNSEANGEAETVKPQDFKYGKYCGKGHPTFASEPGTAQRTADLEDHWPPVDDIDLMCYAHDMCFQETTQSNLICDQAITGILIHAESFTQESGCQNLLRIISSVPLAKPIGSEKNSRSAKWVSFANTVISVPLTTATFLARYPSFKKHGLPKEQGHCYFNDVERLHVLRVISDFEQDYRKYAKGFKKYGRGTPGEYNISIRIPLENWESKLAVFDAQKYLNYYGYKVGSADGIMGTKTVQGINTFNKIEDINSPISDEFLQSTLNELYVKYYERSFKMKMRDHDYDITENREVYGYID